MSVIDLLLPIAALVVLLLGVAAFLPVSWKWLKLIALGVAAIVGHTVVSVGLDLAREESAKARATRDLLEQYLAGIRARGTGNWSSGDLVIKEALPKPPLDSWGNEVHLETHDGLLVVWSYGQDAVRDFSDPPPSCLDRARPYHDVILGLEQTGMIRRLQVPGISGDPKCSAAPDRPPPGYFYPAMAAQVVLAFVFLRRLWLQTKTLKPDDAAVKTEIPVSRSISEVKAKQVFRWRYRKAVYSAILLGVGSGAVTMIELPRRLASFGDESLPGAIAASLSISPWVVVCISVLFVWAVLATMPSEVRFERSGEVRLSGIAGGETISAGKDLGVIGGVLGLYFVGRRSFLVLPFFEGADLLAELLEDQKHPRDEGAV